MTEHELAILCAEWQERLKLQNWKISCKFARFNEIDNNRMADVTYQLSAEKAVIRVLTPDDALAKYGEDFNPSIEESIVHELLHIILAPLEQDGGFSSALEVVQEQTINRLSRALTTLKHQGENHE